MKICIVGAGAIGGYLGVKLIKAGYDVSLVARGEHLDAMCNIGLTLLEDKKKIIFFPKCTDSIETLDKMDFIFITLKAYSIPGMAKDIAKLNGAQKVAIVLLSLSDVDATKIFSLMNEEEITEVSHAMSHLGSVSPEVIDSIMSQLNSDLIGDSMFLGNLKLFLEPNLE